MALVTAIVVRLAVGVLIDVGRGGNVNANGSSGNCNGDGDGEASDGDSSDSGAGFGDNDPRMPDAPSPGPVTRLINPHISQSDPTAQSSPGSGCRLSRSHPRCFSASSCALVPDNHAQLSRASLRIRILDVNDNPPELATPYEAAVCEDAKPGQVQPRG